MKDIVLNSSKEKAVTVTKENLAVTVGSGDLEVFATPMMIALMEGAAASCLEPFLDEGETSVGIKVDCAHIKASKIGVKVTAVATITVVEGKKVSFSVTARDEQGEIGSGSHDRVVVNVERFLARL